MAKRLLCEYVEQTKQMQQEGKLNNCSDKTNNYKWVACANYVLIY